MASITIIDVCRRLRIEPDKKLTWPVGAAVRNFYEEKTGQRPETPLRPKTNAGGTHCIAAYPPWMEEHIARIIESHHTEAQRQFELF